MTQYAYADRVFLAQREWDDGQKRPQEQPAASELVLAPPRRARRHQQFAHPCGTPAKLEDTDDVRSARET